MEIKDIGLKRGTVKVVPYNQNWPVLFEKEKALLEKTLGDKIIAIEHIGSTAILGLMAKPVVDIDIGVDSLDMALAVKNDLEKIGYTHRPFVVGQTKEEMKWQELYVKGPEDCRTYHLHVTVFNNHYWHRDIMFRNYLRKHLNRANEYVELKLKLAQKFPDNRRAYTDGKEQFILDTIKLAQSRITLI